MTAEVPAVRHSGRRALITGAGRGIGQGVAAALGAEGTRLALIDRDDRLLEESAAMLTERGAEVGTFVCDVTDGERISAAVRQAESFLGGIDILVNCAQTGCNGRLLDLSDETFRTAWESGVLGTLRLMKACHGSLRGDGVIINIGSGAALRPDPVGFGAYAAVKEAIRMLTRAAALEWAADGIRVIAIIPLADSPGMKMWRDASPDEYQDFISTIPLGRLGDCETDIGRAVAFLCSRDARFITGSTLMVDGGQAFLR